MVSCMLPFCIKFIEQCLNHLSAMQVLQDFPTSTANLPFQYMIDLIPMLQPRAFSIASSMQVSTAYTYTTHSTHHTHPQAHPGQIQILMAVVKYRTKLHKPRMVSWGCHIFIFVAKYSLSAFPMDSQEMETFLHRVCVPLGCLHWTH